MPLWAVILTVTFSGTIAIATIINIFRSATKESIQRFEYRLSKQIDELRNEITSVRTELKSDINGPQDELRNVRDELRNEIRHVRGDIRDVHTELSKLNQNHIDHLVRHNEAT